MGFIAFIYLLIYYSHIKKKIKLKNKKILFLGTNSRITYQYIDLKTAGLSTPRDHITATKLLYKYIP